MVDIPNMRRVYSRPWQRGSTANPGKVSTGVAVGVRPETTLFAHETMPDALADTSTIGARLAVEPPPAEAGGFWFLLRGRLRGRFAYPVQGWFMQPARWSMKNQRAAQPIPIPDIHRSIGIGVRLVSAPCADVGMFLTLVDRPAPMAGLAGVVRRYRIHRHASSQGLVAHKRLQLIERPIVPVLPRIRPGVFSLPGRSPNAREVLKADSCFVDRQWSVFAVA